MDWQPTDPQLAALMAAQQFLQGALPPQALPPPQPPPPPVLPQYFYTSPLLPTMLPAPGPPAPPALAYDLACFGAAAMPMPCYFGRAPAIVQPTSALASSYLSTGLGGAIHQQVNNPYGMPSVIQATPDYLGHQNNPFLTAAPSTSYQGLLQQMTPAPPPTAPLPAPPPPLPLAPPVQTPGSVLLERAQPPPPAQPTLDDFYNTRVLESLQRQLSVELQRRIRMEVDDTPQRQAISAALSSLGHDPAAIAAPHPYGSRSEIDARITSIMEGLRAGAEIRQAEAAQELAELLLMGNEDSLPTNLPIKEIVGLVVTLLQKEHNYELMLTAARCLTNMLEALPRAQPIVIEAVPYLLEKLKRIECIDVAEASLSCLEVMSRRNGKVIMVAGGIAATISHIDFFPLAAQRLAFSIAANCAMFVGSADFGSVREVLPELTQRLMNEDKRSLDSVCQLFSRLTENLRNHPDKLREIAGSNHCMLSNMQQLLVAQPSNLSSTTFPLVIKILRLMAYRCSDIAVALVQMHFAGTLRFLLAGSSGHEEIVDLVQRPSNQLAELVYLTGELFPRLPTSGIFDIDATVASSKAALDATVPSAGAVWYWKDEEGWQPFRSQESKILEIAKMNGERMLHVSINAHVYEIDLTTMRQTNMSTGTNRELRRQVTSPVKKQEERASSSSSPPEEDRRLTLLQNEPDKMETVIRQLFPVLVEIDGSSSGLALRYESLRVMLRMVCPMPAAVLRGVLADLPLSGHIASALASPRSRDLSVVVAALQLVHMLLEKMADVYGPLFRKEGVAHEIEKLAAAVVPCPSFTTLAGPSSSMSTVPSSSSSSTRSAPSSGVGSPALTTARDKSPSPAVSGARSRGASPAIAAALNGDAVPGPSTPAPVVKARNSRRSGDRAARRSVPSSSASVVASASPSAVSEDFDMAEAPSTSSGATTAAAMPPSGADEVPSGSLPSTSRPWKDRHRKRTSPEGGSAGPGSIGGGAKEKNRRKSSSSFLSALRLPSFRGSPSSSPSSATGSPPAQATPPPIDGGAPSSAAAAMAERLQSRRNLARSPASQERYERFMQQMRDAASGVGLPPGMKAPRAGGHGAAYNPGAPAALGSQLTTAQKDKMRSWIKKEAELLMKTYLGDGAANTAEGDGSLSKLREQAAALEKRGADVGEEPLVEIYRILETESISAFELKHSGLMSALHAYLTTGDNQLALIKDRHLPDRKVRLRRFAKIFMKLGPSNLRPSGIDGCFAVYEQLIQKAITSISLLEQFQVKVTDMGGIATGGNGCLRGAQALRFFQSHQIRCNLRRHPACTELSDWRHGHGSIKIDPLTSVSAIERYLTERGIGFVRGGSSGGVADDSSGEDELSDDEGEGVVAPAANGVEDRKIEIVIGDTPVPSTMTVLQALRQYQPSLQDDGSSNSAAIGQSLWMNTHTIYYRAALQPANGEVSGVASGGSTPGQAPATSSLSSAPAPPKDKKHKVADRIWIDGELEPTESPLWAYLENRLPTNLDDPSAPSILLLRALFGLDRYWYTLFDDATTLPTTFGPLIPMSSFISPKLAGKLSRQLSDFLTVATQQIPAWTVDLVRVAPFLFPFALRRSLMYCTAFGRDRALMHLVSQTDNGGGQEADAGRGLTPRLERKKVSIKRDDLLKSAEAALAACVNSNKPMAMLEVSFEGEAGTGFGPTLEFYSSISKELQLSSLKMWHGGVTKGVTEDGASGPDYVNAPHGLHPIATPYGQKGATSTTSRIKKFELVGRLMAQALVDARMIDLPLSPLFLSWLIGDSHRLGIHDLETLDPHLYSSLRQLTMTDEADFEHLEQYFTLPGSESFELMKGGKNKAVSKANAMHFAKLVAHWRLREGVQREMDAVRRGFCSIVDPGHLSMFSSEELEQLFCGCPDDAGDRVWGEAALAAAIKPDHGYSHDSEQVKWLVRMLASFDRDEQRRFVQFVTGSPRLPVGGFRSLNPPLTIVRKANAYGGSNEELPSAMTCYNYLKVPPYSSYEIFHERFSVALRFVTSFHLT